MGFKVRGHICVRRKAKDGEAGAAGRSIRTTVWQAGKQYYAGDTPVDGVYPLDIVSDKAMAIGTSGVNFYMCVRSHTSPNTSNLTNTTYWQKLNSLKPVVTYLILAEAIKANFIDVADLAAASAFIQNLIANTTFTQSLAADSAFINSLSVKHLNGADGVFTGGIQMPFKSIDAAYQHGTINIVTSGGIASTSTGYIANKNSTYVKVYGMYLDTNYWDSFYKANVVWLPQTQDYDGVTFTFYIPPRTYSKTGRDGVTRTVLAPCIIGVANNASKVGILIQKESFSYSDEEEDDASSIQVASGIVRLVGVWTGSYIRWCVISGCLTGRNVNWD